jgi:flavin-binding protein dodecin
MAVIKVIEIMTSSPKGWEDATTIAVKIDYFITG